LGVLSVAAGWSRAAEGLRTRRLVSVRSAWVVIASFVGWVELSGGCRRLVAGCRWGFGSGCWRLGDADHRDRPGDRAVDLSAWGGAFGGGEGLGSGRLGCQLACDGLVCWERRLGE